MAVLSTQHEDKAVLIVAIDFGTTYSGVSFAFSDDVSTHLSSRQLLTNIADEPTLHHQNMAF